MFTVARPWALLVALLCGMQASALKATDADKGAEEKAGDARVRQLRGKLAHFVNLDGFEANTPIKEALAFLTERYDLPLILSPELFKMDKDFEGRTIKANKLVGVRVRAVLALLLEQVDADMVQRDGMLLIIPRDQARPADLLRHRVEVDFDKRPLAAALEELADATGFNIVLDPRVADKGKTPLTASFKNVPLETAVRVLTDMADLKPVLLDNVFYVTTRANAAVLLAEEARRDKAPAKMAKVPVKDPEPVDEEKKP